MKTIQCPHCGNSINIDDQGRVSVFCNYCGKQIKLQGENSATRNININKDIKIHKRYTNDADVIRATNEANEGRRTFKYIFAIFGIFLLIPALIFGGEFLSDSINEGKGRIHAGSYDDLIGENYKTVEAHFRAAGFENIKLIDLDDAGLAFWDDGEVVTVSVGGDTSFTSSDWFDPDTKVVISYH